MNLTPKPISYSIENEFKNKKALSQKNLFLEVIVARYANEEQIVDEMCILLGDYREFITKCFKKMRKDESDDTELVIMDFTNANHPDMHIPAWVDIFKKHSDHSGSAGGKFVVLIIGDLIHQRYQNEEFAKEQKNRYGKQDGDLPHPARVHKS